MVCSRFYVYKKVGSVCRIFFSNIFFSLYFLYIHLSIFVRVILVLTLVKGIKWEILLIFYIKLNTFWILLYLFSLRDMLYVSTTNTGMSVLMKVRLWREAIVYLYLKKRASLCGDVVGISITQLPLSGDKIIIKK